jgi:hypothetical protein
MQPAQRRRERMSATTELFGDCLTTTAACIAACERCAKECGLSGDPEREKCAALCRDCADVARLSEALMLRGSPYATDLCALHEELCQACADLCSQFTHACCQACAKACAACATTCHSCAA